MAIRTYLQGLGATHLFDLDNNGTLTTDDLGSSSTPTNISGGTYTFDTDPVCEGVTHSLDVVASTSSGTDGAVFTNVSDINSGSTGWSSDKRSLLIWCKQSEIQNPTCIYEQGGGTNNFAFMGGALMTWQAADAGQPFLIVQSKSLTQSDRPYCLVGVWEYHTQHAGSGNRILFYINGILQAISESTGTDSFPSHGGDITCGNSGDNLRSFAGTTFISQTTDKNCNFLGMFNNVSLSQAQCREIFERSTFAEVTIAADTVANQQTAIDALSGTTYENTNCAIRIIQATDATNYRLFIDDITFNADPNLEDISIQFVGTGTLTLENTNGTEIKYTSTPIEVETTSTTYTGGGSIVVVDNTIRYFTPSTITNSTATKLVIETAGSYEISGGTISSVENVSGGSVTILISNGASTPTIIGSGITLTFPDQPISITNISAGSRLRIYNVTTGTETVNTVVSGTTYTSSYQEGTDYTDGDTIRVYLTKLGKAEWSGDVIDTSNGFSVLASQEDDAVYAAMNVDGSTVTKFTPDYPNDQVDIQVAQNFSMAEFYAWWNYNLTSEQGIREFFGGITAIDQANFRINNTIVNLFLDNTTSTNLVQTDNRRIYRADGAYPVIPVTTGGGGIDIVWRNTILIAETNTSGLTAAESAKLDDITDILADTNELQTNQDNWLTATGFATPADIPTGSDIADAVWDEARADHTTTGSYGATEEWTGGLDEAELHDSLDSYPNKKQWKGGGGHRQDLSPIQEKLKPLETFNNKLQEIEKSLLDSVNQLVQLSEKKLLDKITGIQNSKQKPDERIDSLMAAIQATEVAVKEGLANLPEPEPVSDIITERLQSFTNEITIGLDKLSPLLDKSDEEFINKLIATLLETKVKSYYDPKTFGGHLKR